MVNNLQIGQTLTDSFICTKAKEFAKELNFDETKFKASAGWLENFKQRQGIRAGIWFGDGLNTTRPRAMGICGPGRKDVRAGAQLQAQLEFDKDLMSRSPYETSFDEECHPICRPLCQALMEKASEESGPGNMALSRPAPSFQPFYRRLSPPPPTSQRPGEDTYNFRKYGISSADASPPVAQERSFNYGALYGTEVHMPVFNIPDDAVPTINEAEVHLNKVLLFFDAPGNNILKDSERKALQTVKCVLFQATRGVPIRRRSG